MREEDSFGGDLESSRFIDRADAGERLAAKLKASGIPLDHAIVLALPRGGVPVGYRVAQKLNLPLDVITVRKLGAPGQPELALGAIASGGIAAINQEIVRDLGISEEELARIKAREEGELARRELAYRGGRGALRLDGKTVILVDDGVATGSTLLAAVRLIRSRNPERIVIAVPVAPRSTLRHLRSAADEIICLMTPEPFWAVGEWYADFTQVSTEEVGNLLRKRRADESVDGSMASRP